MGAHTSAAVGDWRSAVAAVAVAVVVASGAARLIPVVGDQEVTSWVFLLLAAVGFAERARRARSILRPVTGAEWGGIALAVAGLATVVLGPSWNDGTPGFLRIAQHLTIMVAIGSLTPRWRALRLVTLGLLSGVAVQAVIGVIEFVRGETFFYSLWKPLEAAQWNGLMRLGSTPADPNYFALGLAATLAIVASSHIIWPRSSRAITVAAVGLWGFLIAFTFSRAGYIGAVLLVGLGAAAWLRRRGGGQLARQFQWWHVAVVALAVGLVSVLYLDTVEAVASRLLALADPNDSSIQTRFAAQRAALEVFAANPIFGVGFDRFVKIGPDYVLDNAGIVVPEINVLNSFLLAAAEAGVVGLVGFAFSTVWSVRAFWMTGAATPAPENALLLRALSAGLLVWSVVSLALDGLHSPIQWVFFGLAVLAHRIAAETSTSSNG